MGRPGTPRDGAGRDESAGWQWVDRGERLCESDAEPARRAAVGTAPGRTVCAGEEARCSKPAVGSQLFPILSLSRGPPSD